MLKYILAWLPMVIIGILNGVLREKGYKKYLSEIYAHQASTLLGIIMFGLYIWGVTSLWPIATDGQAWQIGLAWLALTVGFEFIFGHFVMGHPWEKLLQDYNLLKGRIWILVLVWITVAPYVFYKFG